MGRHRKKSSYTVRRHSLIALSGLVPAGIIATASTAGAAGGVSALDRQAEAAPAPSLPSPAAKAEPAAALAAAPKVTDVAATVPPPPPPPAPEQPVALAAGPLGVPGINLAAYKAAEKILAEQNPGCHMPWHVLAGIGRVESTHADDGKADADGNLASPIYGPVLDGSLSGNNVIGDTDHGELDGNATYDRAVGPMQFLPETWKKYAADGNGDGKADPQNLFDAALTTGKYLCDGGLDMRDLGQQSKAIMRYNNSVAYVANVMAWSLGYATGIAPTSDALPQIH